MKKKKIVLTLYLDYEAQEFSRKPLNSVGKMKVLISREKVAFLTFLSKKKEKRSNQGTQ